MRAKVKRLRSLADLAKTDENDAARALGECQRRLAGQTERLEELKSYRQDYVSEIRRLGKSGMGVETIQRYQSFVAKLEETIAMQVTLVEGLAGECEHKRQAWSRARVKHNSLDKAVIRHREAESRRRDRREQELSDESVLGRYVGKENDG